MHNLIDLLIQSVACVIYVPRSIDDGFQGSDDRMVSVGATEIQGHRW